MKRRKYFIIPLEKEIAVQLLWICFSAAEYREMHFGRRICFEAAAGCLKNDCDAKKLNHLLLFIL